MTHFFSTQKARISLFYRTYTSKSLNSMTSVRLHIDANEDGLGEKDLQKIEFNIGEILYVVRRRSCSLSSDWVVALPVEALVCVLCALCSMFCGCE